MESQKLATRCILTSLEINLPSQTRKDAEVTAEIHALKHASSNAGRYSKTLYPEATLEPCKKQANAIRAIWKRYVTPWKDGQGIMLAAALLDFQKEISAEIKKFYDLADIESNPAKFNATLAQAQVDRNGMFDRNDYPVDGAAFRKMFRVSLETLPLPDVNHIILDCAEDELRIVTESYEAKLASAQSDAVEHLRSEMQKPLSNVIAQINNFEKKKAHGERTRLCDSLIENIEDIAKRVGILNITGNDKLTSIGAELTKLADDTHIDSLKNSTVARRNVVDKANNILAKLAQV